MEKFVNSFDSILRGVASCKILFIQKLQGIFKNAYFMYSLLIIFFLLLFYATLKNLDGAFDLFCSFVFLFVSILFMVCITKTYLSNKSVNSKFLEEKILVASLEKKVDEKIQELYSPKKSLSKKVESKLNVFHNTEANKYFDVIESDVKVFTNKIYEEKLILTEDKILLNKELMNLEIRTLLQDLNKITGIPMNMLDKLFMRFSVKEQKYVNVKSSTVNSSESQSNRFLKVNEK